MHHLWEKLAFQRGHGALPYAAEEWEGHCKGQALTSELQEMPQCSHGEAKRGIR